MNRVIAYIDGFNLYHAIDELGKPHLKWLDLWNLSASIARPHEQLVTVNYFSAYANWKPASAQRHRIYVKALKHQGAACIMGHFKEKSGFIFDPLPDFDSHRALRLLKNMADKPNSGSLLFSGAAPGILSFGVYRCATPLRNCCL